MELCKEVQAEEYVIHVVKFTNFYTIDLRFFLLAISWFPWALGAVLWSVLHMILVLLKTLMLLFLFTICLVGSVLTDVMLLSNLLISILLYPFFLFFILLSVAIYVALVWIWLVLTCRYCVLPGQPPEHDLAQYFFLAGGTNSSNLSFKRLGKACIGPCWYVKMMCGGSPHFFPGLTVELVKHVKSESFPYWRENLGDLCREIVPWYDAVVV